MKNYSFSIYKVNSLSFRNNGYGRTARQEKAILPGILLIKEFSAGEANYSGGSYRIAGEDEIIVSYKHRHIIRPYMTTTIKYKLKKFVYF